MTNKDFNPESLKFYRKISSGISQRALGEMLGYKSNNPVYRWENGDDVPSKNKAKEIAAILGCKVDDLYGDVEFNYDFAERSLEKLETMFEYSADHDKLSERRFALEIRRYLIPAPQAIEMSLEVTEAQKADADLLEEGNVPDAYVETNNDTSVPESENTDE